jgi:hypothetical protein
MGCSFEESVKELTKPQIMGCSFEESVRELVTEEEK